MLLLKIALYRALLVIFIFLLRERAVANAIFYSSISKVPPTEYYDIWGNKIKTENDGKSGRKIVLTKSKKPKKIDKVIQKHHVIGVPSDKVIDSMNQAYITTERTSKEEGFFVGIKGEVSIIVEGTDTTLPDSIRQLAIDDLKAKNDITAYDVHTHRTRNQDFLPKEGGKYGTPCPSRGENGDLNTRGFTGIIEAKVILGYEPDTAYYQGRCPLRRDENVTVPGNIDHIKFYRTIGFYDASRTFLKLNFDQFMTVVKKINTDNKK